MTTERTIMEREDDYQFGRRIRYFFVIIMVIIIACLVYAAVTNASTTRTRDGDYVITTTSSVVETTAFETEINRNPFERCWTFKQTKAVESTIFKTDVAKASLRQHWCAVGPVITKVNPAQVDHWITGAGNIAQWHDDGVISRSSTWTNWGNHRHGGHITKVRVQFHETLGPVNNTQVLELKANKHANGTVN